MEYLKTMIDSKIIDAENVKHVKSVNRVKQNKTRFQYEITYCDEEKVVANSLDHCLADIRNKLYSIHAATMVTRDKMIAMFNNWNTFSCKPGFSKYPANYIVDEEKSVRWNREQVEQNHTMYQAEVVKLNNAKNDLYKTFVDTVCKYIEQQMDNALTQDDIKRIYFKAYEKGHANGIYEVLSEIDDLCDWLSKFDKFNAH